MGNKIPEKNIEDVYPMSAIAVGMIYHSLKDPAASIYQNPRIYRFRDQTFDLELFKKAFALMVEKHSILRTGFKFFGFDEPIQIVYREIAPAIDYYDISDLSRPQQEVYVRDLMSRGKETPFDFTDAEPLWRLKILSTGKGFFFLLWEGHHAMVDGWSTASLLTELNNTYVTLKTRPDFVPPKLKCTYKDFVIRQIAAGKNPKIIGFWKNQLADYKRFEFPTKGPGEKAANGGTAAVNKKFEYPLDTLLLEQLKKAAITYNTTSKNLCFAAYVYMLNMLSKDNDIVVGLITHNRPQCQDGDKIIGCFLNTVPVRLKIPGRLSWKDFIRLVSGKLLQLKAYDMLSFFEITRMLGEESREGNPITDTIFSYVDFHVYHGLQVSEEGVTIDTSPESDNSGFSVYPDESGDTNTLFNFTVDTTYGNFIVSVSYSPRITGEAEVKKWCGWFVAILQQMIHEPGALALKHELISQEERQKILYEFNNTQREYPREKTLQRLFAEQVEKTPDDIVAAAPLQVKNRTDMTSMLYISYRELNRKSRQLALLLQEKGVEPGTIVGIMVERSIEMIIGLLGILKVGGAYLPIDPGYPDKRIDFMLADCGSEILLTTPGISKEIKYSNGIVHISDAINRVPTPHLHPEPTPATCLAYIIYTSGSTGKPKGVMIQHHSVVRLVKSTNFPGGQRGERWLPTGSIAFDITTFEIWYPLLNGLTLFLVDRDTVMDAVKLQHFIIRSRISLLHLIPQLFNQLADRQPGIFAALNCLLVGGDVVRPHYVNEIRKKNENLKILHMYGPTENTTFSTFFPVDKDYETSIPIGKPISNTSVYILDKHGQIQPIGTAGELCTGGDGLARGYLNNPELTFERFDHDLWDYWDYRDEKKNYKLQITKKPAHQLHEKNNQKFLRGGPGGALFTKSAPPGRRRPKIYKTGDLACWLPDGNIEFLGRSDHQVKIRGFRVELGEIENRLQEYKDVKEAVVVLRGKEPDHKQIIAYVVIERDKKINNSELREYLLRTLPGFMVPAHVVQLERIPLTASGKIDRKALPEPQVKDGRREAYAPPGSEVEKKLVEIWGKLLARESIGIHDNFFALGGDSIQAIQVAARMNEAGYRIEIRDILQGNTIAQLALLVKKKDRSADQSIITGTVPLTPIQKRFFESAAPRNWHCFSQAVMLYSREGFTKETVEELFTKLVEHHDALRMIFAGSSPAMVQENRGIEGKLFDLEVFNFEDIKDGNIEKEIQNKAGRIQGSMDLENGPLVKLGLFKTRQGDHLLVVIHHLVVDGISWRILLADFSTGYGQRQQGKEITFPEKTDSFKYWSGRLSEYAVGSAIQELQYWKAVESQAQKVYGLPGSGNRCLCESDEKKAPHHIDTTAVNLNQQETETLLSNVNHAYNTEINDILLTALGLALTDWSGGEKVLIDLESHGREPIFSEIDISRTVGWFTGQYPVLLEISPGKDLAYTIKSVKETLRRIPNKGIGYGILRYLTPDEKKEGYRFQCEPGISFNYLGQWQEESQGGPLRISGFHSGEDVSADWEQNHALVINGMKAAGELKFVFSFNSPEYDKKSIKNLAAGFCVFLRRIITHCSQKQESEYTPSDLGCNKISLEDFSRITESIAARIAGNPHIEALYPLSPMQRGMLYHALKNKEADIYFVQSVFKLEGQVEPSLLEKSVNKLVERYDILRTIFFYENLEEPLQAVLKERTAQVYYEDLTGWPPKKKTSYIQEFIKKDKSLGLDLGRDCLIRLSLFKTGLKSYDLVWSFHHILMDGWCLGIVYKELIEIYRLFTQEQPIELGAVTPYKTYIQWLEKQDKAAGLRYWRKYLAGCEQKTGLSADMPKPGENQWKQNEDQRSQEHNLIIAESLASKIKETAENYQVTLGAMFQALWGVLLQKYNNCDDVVFGVVVSGRPAEIRGIEQMVGLFINTVPLRIRIPAGQTFSQSLKILRDTNISTRPYEHIPLAEIQAQSALRASLFDHIMVFENYPIHEEVKKTVIKEETGTQRQYPAVDFKLKDMDIHEQTNYDFNIIVVPGSPFLVKFVYNGRVYDSHLVMNIGLHLEAVLSQAADNPDTVIEKIELITREEKQRLIFDFNRSTVDYPKDKLLQQLFAEQQKRTPDKTALHGRMIAGLYGNDAAITYKELNERSHYLARILNEKGVVPGSIVGIMVERSVEMIIGILAILEAGGAYLPIDPGYPGKRIEYMLKDSGAEILLKDNDFTPEAFNNLPKDTFSHLHLPPAPATSLAYTIYTSGSTGRPKGVLVQHRNVTRLVKNTNFIEANPDDRLLLTGALVFDITSFEIWWPLVQGITLFLVNQQVLADTEKLKIFMIKNKISILHLVPQLFNQLAAQKLDIFQGLRYFLVGGDLVRPQYINLLRNADKTVKILHMYGPTENTTFSTYLLVDKDYENRIPLGKPINNTYIYILNKHGGVQPIGVAGELCIGGDGVARGYLNQPGLTCEKFDQDLWDYRDKKNKSFCGGSRGAVFTKSAPLAARGKIYKTGDLARWLVCGNIEFLGRLDHQLKIRGVRIESGEIETQLLNHEQVREAVVIARENTYNGQQDTGKYLCAYIVLKEEAAPDISKLKEFLSGRLPNYMIPSYFVLVKKIPLTPGGKVDRWALPAPVSRTGGDFAPGSEIEKKLAAIWREVLGEERSSIGIHDNFFELGGHSLKVMMLTAKIHKVFHINLAMKEVFIRPTIKELSEYLGKAAKDQYTGIAPAEKKEYYPLSSAQKRLYFIQQLDLNSTGYNLPLFLPLGKEIERNRLEAVLKQLINRHESLRTSFERVNQEPVQRILTPDEILFTIEYYDLAAGSTAGKHYKLQNTNKRGRTNRVQHGDPKSQEAGIKSCIDSFVRPFDLSRAPLLRSGLIKLADGNHTWMVDIHHIISDGTSHGVLTEDFMSLYHGEKPDPLRLQYKDFSEWQNHLSSLEKGRRNPSEEYWLRLYKDADRIARLQLPTDYKRPEVFTFDGAVYRFMLDPGDALNFKKLGVRAGATLYMNLLAVLDTLFYKYAGQTDIIMGTAVAGRPHDDLQRIIGMFVNTLAMRNYPEGEKTYETFLNEVTAQSVNAFEHQDIRFEELVEKLNLERDPSRNPLFDITMVVQNMMRPKQSSGISSPDQVQSTIEAQYQTTTSKFDMSFFVNEHEGNIHIDIEYYTGIFKQETIKRLAAHFKKIIKTVGTEPCIKLKDIEIISEDEKKQLLFKLNDTAKAYPKDKTIHRLFEEEVDKTPDHLALLDGEEGGKGGINLTYRELNQRANQLANYLYLEKNIRPEEAVGVRLERSPLLLTTFLGILKSGGAYVPLDPDYPKERLKNMMTDAAIRIVISQESEIKFLHRLPEYDAQPPGKNAASRQLAYVIYTSGSTGKPKGVMVEHRSVVRLVKENDFICWKPGDRMLPTGSITFDISTFEIWGPLLNGVPLVLAGKSLLLNGQAFERALRAHRVTHLHLIPQLFNQLAAAHPGIFAGLHYFLVGGDRVFPRYVNEIKEKYPALKILHMYGPTENTTFSTFFPVERKYNHRLPLGRPLANTTVYILDQNQRLQPPGVYGELCTGGDGVARGYLNNPELTAEQFCLRRPGGSFWKNRPLDPRKNFSLEGTSGERGHGKEDLLEIALLSSELYPRPYALGPRLYKTGDLARWLPDGNLEFLERIDTQVKIRGFRIETGEIETHLLGYPGIKEAIVTSRPDENKELYLCAYLATVQGKENKIKPADLRLYLSGKLPDYMIPSYFVHLEKMPLLSNGKIHRKALPEPGIPTGDHYAAPRTELEKKLVEIWADILDKKTANASSIGIDDNFFQLGGHSLKATILVSKIHQAFGVKLPLTEILNTPFIRGIAAKIREAGQTRFLEIEAVEEKEYYEPSYNQKRLWTIDCRTPNRSSYHMPEWIQLNHAVNIELIKKTLSRIFTRYESFRTGIKEIHNKPALFIRGNVEIPFEIIDLAALAEDEKQQRAQEIINRFITRPFDLGKPPLFRSMLIKQDQEKFVLVYNMHHIISDGWSMEILRSDFNRFYRDYSSSIEPETAPLQYRYKDFAQWHNRQIRDPKVKAKALRYWKKLIDTGFPALKLPYYHSGESGDSSGAGYRCVIDSDIKNRLHRLAEDNHTSLFTLLFAAYNLLLAYLSGEKEIVATIISAGREHPSLHNIVGYFINPVIIKIAVDLESDFEGLLSGVKKNVLEAFQHQNYPLELVLEDLHLPFPNVSTAFNFLNMQEVSREIELDSLEPVHIKESLEVKYPLVLYLIEYKNGIETRWAYQKSLFKAETSKNIAVRFLQVLNEITRDENKITETE